MVIQNYGLTSVANSHFLFTKIDTAMMENATADVSIVFALIPVMVLFIVF